MLGLFGYWSFLEKKPAPEVFDGPKLETNTKRFKDSHALLQSQK